MWRSLVNVWNIHFLRDRTAKIIRVVRPLGENGFLVRDFLIGDLAEEMGMQLSRARSFVHGLDDPPGASGMWVRSSIASLALVYCSQRRRDSRSIGLSFHCLSGS